MTQTNMAAKGRVARALRPLILSAALSHLLPAFADSPATSIQLSYDVFKGSFKIGEIEESYVRERDHYTLISTTHGVGLVALIKPGRIIIKSSGLINPRGLQPLRFSDVREGEEYRNRSAEFDWEAKQLTLIHQEERNVLSLQDGTQDRLSVMYQFMFLPLKPGSSLDFPMTNGGKLDNYHYVIALGPRLDTSAGNFDTLYVENQPKKNESKTEIWLAVKYHNLPFKMTITDPDGGQLTQLIKKFSVAP